MRLRDYPGIQIPPAPPSWDGLPGATLRMYGNDRYGDCTCAAVANLASVQAAGYGQPLAFADPDVVKYYFDVTGGADEGANEIVVLSRVLSQGFNGWKIRAWAGVDVTDHGALRAAAAAYQGVYLGIDLPDGWGAGVAAGLWDVTGEPNPDNGHAVVVVGFDADGVVLATWGQALRATWAWVGRYVKEAYVVLDEARCSVDVLGGAQLIADAAALAAESGSGG